MQSSEDRAADHLIAERTLALAGDRPVDSSGRSRRGILLAALAVVLGLGIGAVVWLKPWAQAAAPLTEDGPAAAAVGNGQATLNCNSWPPATVYVDGRRQADSTPISNLHLAPGPHQIRLVSKDGALKKEIPVTLNQGEVRTLSVALER